MDTKEAGRDMESLAWWREYVRTETPHTDGFGVEAFDAYVDSGISPQEAAALIVGPLEESSDE